MIDGKKELVIGGYTNTSDVPKDKNIFYRCIACGKDIPSIPTGNIGCDCGNVFIDKDCWRLVVADFSKFEVVKKVSALE